MADTPKPGAIAWTDLTVPDAEALRDFYSRVVGWTPQPLSMGEYSDYVMVSSDGSGVAGVCHARGSNADLPPQWLVYIVVRDVNASAAECVALGGTIVAGPRPMGGGRFCVIRDPAGAVCALFAPPE
jgi:uncharacterized protein